jgi:hypothetical protein
MLYPQNPSTLRRGKGRAKCAKKKSQHDKLHDSLQIGDTLNRQACSLPTPPDAVRLSPRSSVACMHRTLDAGQPASQVC